MNLLGNGENQRGNDVTFEMRHALDGKGRYGVGLARGHWISFLYHAGKRGLGYFHRTHFIFLYMNWTFASIICSIEVNYVKSSLR